MAEQAGGCGRRFARMAPAGDAGETPVSFGAAPALPARNRHPGGVGADVPDDGSSFPLLDKMLILLDLM